LSTARESSALTVSRCVLINRHGTFAHKQSSFTIKLTQDATSQIRLHQISMQCSMQLQINPLVPMKH